MRGKRGDGSSSRRAGRIIPAHAGQTWFKAGDAINSPDHPRACGANKNDARSSLPLAGSSPRMRGKPVGKRHLATLRRIIPAHAGQTKSCTSHNMTRPDHPRACGANVKSPSIFTFLLGSSPRMRGKLVMMTRDVMVGRIIPAHAGQTLLVMAATHACPDHPRACGANTVAVPPPL